MTVVVDGVAVGRVDYNHCRDGATPPAGPGACHDDIATLFPNMSNITPGSGAIGLLNLDTTTLTNGVHTIAWAVTDNQGEGDGIGSRFFSVLNGGSSLTATGSALRAASASGMSSTADALAAPAQVLGAASDVAWRSVSSRDVDRPRRLRFRRSAGNHRRGFAGVRRVRMPELGRIELRFGARHDGRVSARKRQRCGRCRRAVSSIPATGQFTWVPGPGYIGTLRPRVPSGRGPGAGRRHDREESGAKAPGMMRGWVDVPATGETVAGRFIVAGWALDTAAWQGPASARCTCGRSVATCRRLAQCSSGRRDLGGARPDVAAAYGPQFSHAGWGLTRVGARARHLRRHRVLLEHANGSFRRCQDGDDHREVK